ncbi:retrotransposon protein, putative, ty1-copia subclass [Tanacetum coccineum]|uniref:Retrotransposon protein, putative, ty1-copia subclass n=1 Tax=Tanacetum coccineum TaxID=301880 RepID=A0ABQ5D056_9ASTR
MARSHPRFKRHTNEQCNRIPPLLKVGEKDEKNGISHAYQKLKGFYKGVLNLEPDYIRNAKTEEWLTRGHISDIVKEILMDIGEEFTNLEILKCWSLETSRRKSHKVLGIAPVAIIDRQLPFEYTITSRSTDMVVNAVYDAYNEVACLILGSMTPELHKQFENSSPYDMVKELKYMFEKQAGVERFDLIQSFHACKQEEGKSVAAYVLQMKGYVDQPECLGYVLPQDLTMGVILNDLTKDFAGFVRSYNMHNMGKTICELHAMLIEYEKGLPKKADTPQGNDKQVYIPKPKNSKPSAKEHPAKDDTCHHCKEVGHWKRNCHVYLAELLKKRKQVGSTSSSGIFTIELFVFPNKSWVYDTDCGTHVCITKQGFREARKLKQGALYLYVGNGVHAQVEAIGSYDLVLPNGLVICLDNCHYAPSITRGVVSVHRLVENGFVQCFTDFGILVWRCVVLVKRDTPDKLQQRSVKCIFIGYLKETMGYYFYFPPENKIVVARYAEFFEKNLITQEVSGRAIE